MLKFLLRLKLGETIEEFNESVIQAALELRGVKAAFGENDGRRSLGLRRSGNRRNGAWPDCLNSSNRVVGIPVHRN